jgi:hydroxymethylbilane synthase
MSQVLRIGTRDSQLAVWQASLVKDLLEKFGIPSTLVYIKSEGDVDTVTPLYALGVQGIFTKTLDAALLNNRIDLAVHSMKDVPVQLAEGIMQYAVLKRASYKDILVYKNDQNFMNDINGDAIIATSSIRRMAQWLNRYPNHTFENLRGNVNTRLKKVRESNWNGAIFAAAGLERIGLRPETSIDLQWMLPAPAQGAIMIAGRDNDEYSYKACEQLNDKDTAICTKAERDFLKRLMGGCSTPISALAEISDGKINLRGNIVSPDGKEKVEIERTVPVSNGQSIGVEAAQQILSDGGKNIMRLISKNDIPHHNEL